MKSYIELSPKAWVLIKAELYLRHKRSVIDIRYRSKDVLGFTVREYTIPEGTMKSGHQISGYYASRKRIHLDFYDDAKQTMFLLQFSEFLKL